jgi:DNA-binding Xre family transcriptional regulator
MTWNLRLTAAQRGIWKASELQRMLAEHGLEISAGKMSNLWSGAPVMIRLADLDVICATLGCEPNDLLLPEADAVAALRTAGGKSTWRGIRQPGVLPTIPLPPRRTPLGLASAVRRRGSRRAGPLGPGATAAGRRRTGTHPGDTTTARCRRASF